MRFIGGIVSAIIKPFVHIWRRAFGFVPEIPDAPDGLIPRAAHNVGFFRTLTAPSWRVAVRWSVVAVGFVVYIAIQLVLAYLVNQLMWWYIAAAFIATMCFVVAASRPALAFLIWVVLSPLGFMFLRMDFGESLPAITFDRVAIAAIGGLLLLRTLSERRSIKMPILGEWLMLGFVFYTFLMVLVSHPGSIKETLQIISERFDHIGLALIAYYIAKSVLTTRKQLTSAIVALVITGIYVAASALYEQYTGTKWFSSFMGGNYRLGYMDAGLGRAAGPLLNPAAMGTFLGITAFLSFHLAAAAQRRATKFFYMLASVFQLIGCYFCFTRSGYVAAILLAIGMPLFARRYRKYYASIAAVGLVVGIIALPIALSNRAVEHRLGQEKTVLFRWVITASTINIIKHHPLTGVGLGEIDNALEQYITNAGTMSGIYARGITESMMYPQHSLRSAVTSHNSILTICAEQGLIGGGLFVGAILAMMLHLFRTRKLLPDDGLLGKDLIVLLLIAVTGHILSTLGYDIRFFKYPTYVLWILFAIGIRLREIAEEERRASQSAVEAPSRAELSESLTAV